jgi:hypothetical protein
MLPKKVLGTGKYIKKMDKGQKTAKLGMAELWVFFALHFYTMRSFIYKIS